MPEEYIDLQLCRDVYHCTPSELDAQDWERVEAHLICLDVEAQVNAQKARPSTGGPKASKARRK